MKQAKIFFKNELAGILTEDENGYAFIYDNQYLKSEKSEPVSLTLPMQEHTFHNNVLFPFFDGLIPEGWLLDIAQKNWKIDLRNRFSLLLACCKDCIGAVSVIPVENNKL
ncbi:MAG: HipA N-terminal domain-containing protein [Candidatus Symbiothrix sp.]|jgi:serine/threonine-protein kinase HipA|nr:HipA N-terminal domain-containing protein [Candidatus Symbiothrix sp.]